MDIRDFGRLGRISALTLGGGGIAGVWGTTDRAEAVATIRAALDAGITMLDLAPAYGIGAESERAAGEALRPSDDVMITTKVQLPDDTERDFEGRIRRSLAASLSRIGRDRIDLLLLHTHLRPRDGSPSGTNLLGWDAYRDAVLPVFAQLVDEGLIRGWGITAVGHPAPVLDALRTAPRPDAAQIVVNALDTPGDLWGFDGVAPENPALLAAAGANGVAVIGIRAVAAGSLTSGLDRPVPAGHPAAADFARAEPFRKLAASVGETPSMLAHRYALSVPGVATVVLGVKNRAELAECVEAEARGPLSAAEMAAVEAVRR
ncbi:aldo/keto reductase [Actinoplanes sp. KI2]|uniref:aldo/keto reductase n=1 Tax=Actinoplanes sp. KI2 TaxID=2983315 RepID=UPI0021D60C6B|nr:aldo/keto reductase [Actinoplanes sp. KI2]MCU7727343.1 aldo/keto reductase [Actinoplanes sp. KI2]